MESKCKFYESWILGVNMTRLVPLLRESRYQRKTKQLRELETDGFVSRYIYQEIPPKVEYSLTDLGKSFVPVLQQMKQWGKENLPHDDNK